MLPRIIPREEIEQLLNYMYAQENNMDKYYKYWLRDIAVIEQEYHTEYGQYRVDIKKVCLFTHKICYAIFIMST